MALIACFLPLPLYVWAAVKISRASNFHDLWKQECVLLAIAAPITLLIAFWDWKTGTYARRVKRAERSGVEGTIELSESIQHAENPKTA
jgi:hypothetical protein